MAGDSSDEQKQVIKNAIKEAAKEWLEDQYREFGRWTVKGLAALAFVTLLWLILERYGWKHSN